MLRRNGDVGEDQRLRQRRHHRRRASRSSRTHQRQPFFTYLAFNAPHTPLEVPADKYAKYRQMNLQAEDFAGPGHPVAKNFDPDVTAKIYGMVENIDDNVGRVLATLD